SVTVGLCPATVSPPTQWRISARANVVLPAPRSPDSVMRSPGSSAAAMSVMKRCIAVSFGNTIVKLAPPEVVGSIDLPCLLGRRQLGGLLERKRACDRGAAADLGIDTHRPAVQ